MIFLELGKVAVRRIQEVTDADRTHDHESTGQEPGTSDRAQAKDTPWLPHPRIIEDDYTITDAVVVGTLLNSLLRHGDRVTVEASGL